MNERHISVSELAARGWLRKNQPQPHYANLTDEDRAYLTYLADTIATHPVTWFGNFSVDHFALGLDQPEIA